MRFDNERHDLIMAIGKIDLDEKLKNGEVWLRSVNRGEIIHSEGDPCEQMEVILTGDVCIERIDHSGNLLNIAAFGCGEILGGNLVFSCNPFYPMTVTALNQTQLLVIPQNMIFYWCNKNPDFLRIYLTFISNHSLILSHKIKDYFDKPLRERLFNYFRKQSILQQSKTIDLPISKTALAEFLGVQRTSVSRELQRMKAEGLIDYSGRKVILKLEWPVA